MFRTVALLKCNTKYFTLSLNYELNYRSDTQRITVWGCTKKGTQHLESMKQGEVIITILSQSLSSIARLILLKTSPSNCNGPLSER